MSNLSNACSTCDGKRDGSIAPCDCFQASIHSINNWFRVSFITPAKLLSQTWKKLQLVGWIHKMLPYVICDQNVITSTSSEIRIFLFKGTTSPSRDFIAIICWKPSSKSTLLIPRNNQKLHIAMLNVWNYQQNGQLFSFYSNLKLNCQCFLWQTCDSTWHNNQIQEKELKRKKEKEEKMKGDRGRETK